MRRTVLVLLLVIIGLATAIVLVLADRRQPATTTTAATSVTTTITPATTTVPPTVSSLAPGESVCDHYGEVEESGTVAAADLVEVSGIAVGRVNPEVIWAHNDSRAGSVVSAIGGDGTDLGSFTVQGAVAFDWEDMAVGPGPTPDQPYLYVGDIGDNFAIRNGQITVYRLPEPAIGPGADPVLRAESLILRYPEGEALNAEAMFVDPSDAALYIVTRNREVARVYRAEAAIDAATIQDLTLLVSLPLGAEVTGADISHDGTVIALRGEEHVWMWHRPPGMAIAEALSAAACAAPSPDERQGESIGFTADGSYVTISEGAHPPIHLVRRGG
jgi:hypothetical protein